MSCGDKDERIGLVGTKTDPPATGVNCWGSSKRPPTIRAAVSGGAPGMLCLPSGRSRR